MSLTTVYLRALGLLGVFRTRMIAVLAANVVLAIMMIAEPILFGRTIDAISRNGDIVSFLLCWVAIVLASSLLALMTAREADRMAHERRARLLVDAYSRIIAMPLSWHSQQGSANSVNTLLRACEALFGIWLGFLRSHMSTAVAIVILVPTAVSMDVRLTLVLLVLAIVYLLIGRLTMQRTRLGQASVEGHYQATFAHVTDTMSNVSVLQSYNRVQSETAQLRLLSERLLSAQLPVLDWWALASSLNRVATMLSMTTVLVLGVFLYRAGEIGIGEIIAFIGFSNLLVGRLEQLSSFAAQVFEARAKLEEFFRLKDMTLAPASVGDSNLISVLDGKVEFRNVDFSYGPTAAGVTDISFAVQPGQTVAIVGPTGAGKTTLINLLQRMIEPQRGQILLDDVDISRLDQHDLREQIATVFQDAGLLNRSIGENIAMGRRQATFEDVRWAASAAFADEFISARPLGYEGLVGERGSRLSGGERQRIAIARAILKQAPILVMDEATSALDVETEARVKSAIDTVRSGRTTFVVAHRLSTIRNADLILVVDAGRIVESGSYAALSLLNGRFASFLRESGMLATPASRPERARSSAIFDQVALA